MGADFEELGQNYLGGELGTGNLWVGIRRKTEDCPPRADPPAEDA